VSNSCLRVFYQPTLLIVPLDIHVHCTKFHIMIQSPSKRSLKRDQLMFDVHQMETINLRPPIVHEVVIDSEAQISWNTPLSAIASHHLATMNNETLDRDWRLNDFFGTIVVINLPQSKERLAKTTQELYQINTHTFEVFPAIDGRLEVPSWMWQKFKENREVYDPDTIEGGELLDKLHQGEAGCYLSHYKTIQKIKCFFDSALADFEAAMEMQDGEAIKEAEQRLRKYSRVLIFEDDVGFGEVKRGGKISKKGVGRLLREGLGQLPEDWDMLYLIVNPIEPVEQVSSHLYKLKQSWGLCGYAVNYRMYEPLIDLLKKIEDPNEPTVLMVDKQISGLHDKYAVYVIGPLVGFTQGLESIISGKEWALPRQDKASFKFSNPKE